MCIRDRFGESVRDELLCGQKATPERTARADEVLDALGLGALADRHPATLSGGQKQRLALGVALMHDASVIVLDEPTSGLDGKSMRSVGRQIEKLAHEGRVILMITHDVDEAILLSDRILLMSAGPHARIAESVEVDLPRGRTRASLHHEPRYYEIRNHLVDFLVDKASHKE